MKQVKRVLVLVVVTGIMMAALAGCGKDNNKTDKIKELDFTVISEDNLPEELKTILEEKKIQEFKVTYQDKGFLYICIGYGEQQTGGYSIRVNDLYLTDNAIYADTTLLGPDPEKQEELKRSSQSYPYIVIKTEHINKSVVFN